MMLLAALLGMLFTGAGLAVAYEPDLPAGATIILLACVSYLLSASVTGCYRKWQAHRRLST
jgi:zinc transport system permease protein